MAEWADTLVHGKTPRYHNYCRIISIFYNSKFVKYGVITFFPMRIPISQTLHQYFPDKHQIQIKFQHIPTFVGQLIQFSLGKQTTSKVVLKHTL
jgi:hypothetical protein